MRRAAWWAPGVLPEAHHALPRPHVPRRTDRPGPHCPGLHGPGLLIDLSGDLSWRH
ncbi:peroxisomal hydratase-dehydrogenase-epimerase [Streptomyces filamentosus NRRL 15998]|uniref:Peroxisomal hydratase-dehydrogenase-epimerase n=1 Tax=Streptomyces filamentosus NRRL 15998 TaxID=457431 RepID=D6AEN4_STRFL|nr:peroxisomal hydratase-dehydrogenase-epimerase [Streptomyces filamentosus NRRL 15998]